MSSLEENPIVFREREREKDYFFRNLVILDTHSKPLRIERGIIASGSLANVNACFLHSHNVEHSRSLSRKARARKKHINPSIKVPVCCYVKDEMVKMFHVASPCTQ